jgi:hypothetical protein
MSEHTLSFREYHLFNLCLQGDKEAILKFGKLVAMDEQERCITIIDEECRSHLDILTACRRRIREEPE